MTCDGVKNSPAINQRAEIRIAIGKPNILFIKSALDVIINDAHTRRQRRPQ